jgi:hypothetical protein
VDKREFVLAGRSVTRFSEQRKTQSYAGLVEKRRGLKIIIEDFK